VQEVMEFGPITALLDDPAIGKISINSAQDVWIERLGQPEHTHITFRDEDHVMMLIRKVADIVGGRIDAKVPLLDRPLAGWFTRARQSAADFDSWANALH
jgi:pilus assembly protein CpaF